MIAAKIVELIPSFIESIDRTDKTRQTYMYSLKAYFNWHIGKKGWATHDVTAQTLMQFKKESTGSDNTLALRITSLKKMFQWLTRNGYTTTDPSIDIRQVKRRQEYKKVPLQLLDVNLLLASIDKSTEIGLRNHLIISMMFFLGLRRVEVVRMDVGDIQSSGDCCYISVQGKGQSSSNVTLPLPGFLVDEVEAYLSFREPGATGPLFVSTAYRNRGGRLSDVFVSMMVKAQLRGIGIDDDKITCHSLRHGCAVTLLKQGVPQYNVQVLLRHSSSEITRIYTHFIEKEITERQTKKAIELMYDNMKKI
jgi:integrase/recombinase XerD